MVQAVKPTYTMQSKVLPYPGMAAWRFLTLPKKQGQEIKQKFGSLSRGWGSLPVSVIVGSSTWNTSIFPDKKSGSYLLPLKAKIRKVEGIKDHSTVSFVLTLR
jgi:hypothetical protein